MSCIDYLRIPVFLPLCRIGMRRHPFTTITNSLDGEFWLWIREIGYLVWEELAGFKEGSGSHAAMACEKGEAHNEPKLMDGMARMSSVSTPYEPSNEGPGSKGLGGVWSLAYNFGHFRQ